MRDEWFIRGKVPMTKSEVRAVSVSRLELNNDSILLDVGSGTGSVSAEAAMLYPGLRIAAFEKNPEAVELTGKNLEKAGALDRAEIIPGEVPETLGAWAAERIRKRKRLATHAFLGGTSGRTEEVLDLLFSLMPHIRIVANVIALETLETLLRYTRERQIPAEVSSVQVSRGEAAGVFTMMRGQNPVWVVSFGGENKQEESMPEMTARIDSLLPDYTDAVPEELEEQYRELIRSIKALRPDEEAEKAAEKRWDESAMPLGALGAFQEMIGRMAALTKDPDVCASPRALAVFCSDNGIVAEHVTQTGQGVTAVVARHMAERTGISSIMAKRAGADLFPVDVGIAEDPFGKEEAGKGLIVRKLFRGTKNFLEEDAMSREETLKALLTGAALSRVLAGQGYRLIAGGEMGIGNTCTASAVACILLGTDPAEVTGKGAGLSDEGLEHKIRVIREGIRRRNPDPGDALRVLASVGGADIAALTGLYLGAAACRVPVLIDGFIACAAALTACRICPEARISMLASHCSAENGTERILHDLGLVPVITAGMHLGEGTGALMLLPLLDMALEVYRGRKSFSDMGIEAYVPL